MGLAHIVGRKGLGDGQQAHAVWRTACGGAGAADAFLQEHGFVVRRMDAYGLPNALRVTIGTEEANRGLVACLRDFLS